MSTQPSASPAQSSRGPYAKTARTRDAILDAALEVFAASGYRSGSLREITQRAGIAESSIFHHFPTKEDLLAATLELRDRRLDELAHMDDADPMANLRGLIKLAEHNARNIELVRLHTTLSAEACNPDHPSHDYFVRRYASYVARLERTFLMCSEAGVLNAIHTPKSAARHTVSSQDGLQVQWLLDPDGVDLAREVATALQSLVTRTI